MTKIRNVFFLVSTVPRVSSKCVCYGVKVEKCAPSQSVDVLSLVTVSLSLRGKCNTVSPFLCIRKSSWTNVKFNLKYLYLYFQQSPRLTRMGRNAWPINIWNISLTSSIEECFKTEIIWEKIEYCLCLLWFIEWFHHSGHEGSETLKNLCQSITNREETWHILNPCLSLCCHLPAASQSLNVLSCLSSAAERLTETLNWSSV